MQHIEQPEHQQVDLRNKVRELMQREKLPQRLIAREAGIGETALNQWLGEKYPGDNAALEAKLERWRTSYQQRQTTRAALVSLPGFLPTPTSEKIHTALSYAQWAGDIAVIYGAAGLGKTCTATHYAATNPNVWLATLSPAASTVTSALATVCSALGLRDLASSGANRLYNAAVERVRDTAGLLILDEAQHLSIAALDQMRSLHDATGIGLALVGNETVYARMTGGRAAYLDRLHSRIGKRLPLPCPLKGDVEVVAAAWQVSGAAEMQLLHTAARQSGALRLVSKLLRLASVFAADAPIALSHIQLASADLVS